MSNWYYTKFGLEASGALNFTIRCNLIMKELSYIFKNYRGEDQEYIAIQLEYNDINSIKPYIIVEDFEKFRNKSREMQNFSYLDGWTLDFEGVTESEIPIIQLSSNDYGYNILPPVEKLYLFLVDKYFSKNKTYRSHYGESIYL